MTIKKGYNHLLNSFIKDKKLLKVNKEIGYPHLVFHPLMYETDIEHFSLFEVSYVPFLSYFLTTPTYNLLLTSDKDHRCGTLWWYKTGRKPSRQLFDLQNKFVRANC